MEKPKMVTSEEFLEGKYGRMNPRELAALLECSPGTLAQWRNGSAVFPGPDEDGTYCPVNVLRWTSRRPPTRNAAGQVARASKALRIFMSKYKGELPEDSIPKQVAHPYREGTISGAVNHPEKAKKHENRKLRAEIKEKPTVSETSHPSETPPIKVVEEEGIKFALVRLRQTEKKLGIKVNELIDADDAASGALVFRMWRDSIDQLRKTESEIQEILQAEGSSIPADVAKKVVAAVVSTVTGRLKLMPSQLADELSGRDASEIMEILNGQVSSVLDDLSKAVRAQKI